MSDVPAGLKYTQDHEWIRGEGDGVQSLAYAMPLFAPQLVGDVGWRRCQKWARHPRR